MVDGEKRLWTFQSNDLRKVMDYVTKNNFGPGDVVSLVPYPAPIGLGWAVAFWGPVEIPFNSPLYGANR